MHGVNHTSASMVDKPFNLHNEVNEVKSKWENCFYRNTGFQDY